MAYVLTSVMVRRAAHQRGGETSSTGVIDESGISLLSRGCLAVYRPQGLLQTVQSLSSRLFR